MPVLLQSNVHALYSESSSLLFFYKEHRPILSSSLNILLSNNHYYPSVPFSNKTTRIIKLLRGNSFRSEVSSAPIYFPGTGNPYLQCQNKFQETTGCISWEKSVVGIEEDAKKCLWQGEIHEDLDKNFLFN